MKRVFYIPDEKKELVKKAEEALSEGILTRVIIPFDSPKGESISSAVVKFLGLIVKEYHKRKAGNYVYEIIDDFLPVKLVGKKLTTYIGHLNKQDDLFEESFTWIDGLYEKDADQEHFEINGYQTTKRRLFAEIKVMNNDTMVNSWLTELTDLWYEFQISRNRTFQIRRRMTNVFIFPETFLKDMMETLNYELENYLIID